MTDPISSRVPTPENKGWSVETLLDLVNEKSSAVERRFADFMVLMEANDRRYSERVDLAQRAIDAALAAQKEAVKSALDAADRAVAKAETASEKRFEGVNEFRAQLGDQQRTLMPRAEAEIRFNQVSAAIDVLRQAQTEIRSAKGGVKEGWGWAVGAAGFLLTLLLLGAAIVGFLMRFAK
jgi:chromosome condensin MukBEF ATPase and DNA-binding subunit MukB